MKALDLTFDTPFEHGVKLSDYVKKARYTYVIFLRYFGCRSCQIDMIDLAAAKEQFKAKDAQVLVVLQSAPEVAAEGSKQFELPFDIACDPEAKLYALYNVPSAGSKEAMAERNGAMNEAQAAKMAAKRERMADLVHGAYEGDEYQLPAYFLLDSDMELLRQHRAENMGDMPTSDEYLEMLPLYAADFTFNTQSEKGLKLSDYAKKADRTFLIFLRYFGCSSCQLDMIDLAECYDQFKAKNAQVLVVLQSDPAIARAGKDKFELPFDIVCDPDMALYRLYDVQSAGDYAHLLANPGEKWAEKKSRIEAMGLEHGEYEGDEFQLPAYFLLNKDLEIVKCHRGATIEDMPLADEYLELL